MLLKKMLKEKEINSIETESAGVVAFGGCPASLYAKEMAKSFGVDLSNHASRPLTPEILKEVDLVLAMSVEHIDQIKQIDEGSLDKSYLLRSFPERVYIKKDSIKDPIGGESEDYQLCFQQIESSLRRIFPQLLEWAQRKSWSK